MEGGRKGYKSSRGLRIGRMVLISVRGDTEISGKAGVGQGCAELGGGGGSRRFLSVEPFPRINLFLQTTLVTLR